MDLTRQTARGRHQLPPHVLLVLPGRRRRRRDSPSDADASEIEVGNLTGTPAAPEALKSCLDHFDLCRK